MARNMSAAHPEAAGGQAAAESVSPAAVPGAISADPQVLSGRPAAAVTAAGTNTGPTEVRQDFTRDGLMKLGLDPVVYGL